MQGVREKKGIHALGTLQALPVRYNTKQQMQKHSNHVCHTCTTTRRAALTMENKCLKACMN